MNGMGLWRIVPTDTIVLTGVLMAMSMVCASVRPASGQGGTEGYYASVGLHTYSPGLKALRTSLRDAGGGRLLEVDGGRDAAFVSLLKLGPISKGRQLARGLSVYRYRARSESDDFGLTLEHFSGSLVTIDSRSYTNLRPYWGGGIDLIRLSTEGRATERAAPARTRTTWLWGLNLQAGCEFLLSDYLALGSRATYLYSMDSSFDGVEYATDDVVLAYYMTVVFRK